VIAATRQVPVRRRHARPKPVDQLRILERLASPPDPKPAASSRTLARIKTSKPATIVGSWARRPVPERRLPSVHVATEEENRAADQQACPGYRQKQARRLPSLRMR